MKMTISKVDWIFLAVFLAVIAWVMTRPLAVCVLRVNPVVMRQSNLRSVATLMKNYAQEHDHQYAACDEFQLVMDWAEIPFPEPVLGDDETQDEIWMCPIPWYDRRIPDDLTPYQLGKIPMLHSKVDLNPDGTSVAFWDGSVQLLNNEEFEALIDVEDSICLGCQFPIPNLTDDQEP